jgi:hypothetical protein
MCGKVVVTEFISIDGVIQTQAAPASTSAAADSWRTRAPSAFLCREGRRLIGVAQMIAQDDQQKRRVARQTRGGT